MPGSCMAQYYCGPETVTSSCRLMQACTQPYNPASILTSQTTDNTLKSSGPSNKVNRILKWKKNGILGNFLPQALCENMFLCDFQTRLIELFFFFFCNPHHALPHPHRRLDHFKQTRSSSTTSSPSACHRRTTATTPPSTSWPHLRRYVSDSERPTVAAAVTFIRIKDCEVSTR